MTRHTLDTIMPRDIAAHPRVVATELAHVPRYAPEEAAPVIASFSPYFAQRAEGPISRLPGIFDAGLTSTSTATAAQASLKVDAPSSTTEAYSTRTFTRSTFPTPGGPA